ncbi:hypothetical protein [Burkholderia lata]|uniref:hypothetical protein n=1 Tax=Burkholderia lata (strain ATCC 17760 / DSM 23089 / LMG 22485 / NCIMB 9086 / R18194 / 383) TaxID=482957 RepID=UPI00399BBBF1
MDYVTRYTDLIYFTGGDLAICRYRLITRRSEAKQIVVQIDNHMGSQGILTENHQARDAVLNRIADRDLAGIPFAMLCIALTESDAHKIVVAEPDLEDYIHRGHPFQQTRERAARGRHIERISIESRNLVIGRARILTAHSTLTSPAADLGALLNGPDNSAA